MKDEADAKRMFFDYACNTFFMAPDGVYEEYTKDIVLATCRKKNGVANILLCGLADWKQMI